MWVRLNLCCGQVAPSRRRQLQFPVRACMHAHECVTVRSHNCNSHTQHITPLVLFETLTRRRQRICIIYAFPLDAGARQRISLSSGLTTITPLNLPTPENSFPLGIGAVDKTQTAPQRTDRQIHRRLAKHYKRFVAAWHTENTHITFEYYSNQGVVFVVVVADAYATTRSFLRSRAVCHATLTFECVHAYVLYNCTQSLCASVLLVWKFLMLRA